MRAEGKISKNIQETITILKQKIAYCIVGKFGGEFNLAVWRLVRALPNLIPTKFYMRQNFVGCHLTIERTRSEVWTCKDRMALYNFISQDGPTLLRKITCESSTLTQKGLEKANAKVKHSIEHESVKPQKVLPPTMESTYSCICDGLEHNSLVETLPWLRLWSSHFSQTMCRLPPKHDDIIKICMRDCQSPNLNSANIYFWPLGDHFAKYNSRQVFRLYGIFTDNCN